MSPSTITDPRRPAAHSGRRARPVPAPRRPVVIRPFAAPVVRELPPRRAAAGTGW
jgi:hypothetical protein